MGFTMRQDISNKSSCYCLLVILLGALGGCSIFSDDKKGDEQQDLALNHRQINQYVKEWKDAKPKVERLTALEQDLALIIKEVGKLSTIKGLPPQYANQQLTDIVRDEYNIDNSVVSAGKQSLLPSKAKNDKPQRQLYAAHLALFLQEDSARIGWSVISQRYPEILNGLTPVVKKVNRNKQTIYSLRVGPFSERDTADSICNILSRYKYRCEATIFSGNPILI